MGGCRGGGARVKVVSDARGFALIFESEALLDRAIASLTALRDFKRAQNKSYPAVFTYTSERMSGSESKQFHDEVFWMGFSVQGQPRPGEPGSGPREDG